MDVPRPRAAAVGATRLTGRRAATSCARRRRGRRPFDDLLRFPLLLHRHRPSHGEGAGRVGRRHEARGLVAVHPPRWERAQEGPPRSIGPRRGGRLRRGSNPQKRAAPTADAATPSKIERHVDDRDSGCSRSRNDDSCPCPCRSRGERNGGAHRASLEVGFIARFVRPLRPIARGRTLRSACLRRRALSLAWSGQRMETCSVFSPVSTEPTVSQRKRAFVQRDHGECAL
jgi:hypothetical protein